jgi:FkbM family methyltransferase
VHDRQFPASEAYRLDNPERLLSLPPAEVIGALRVRPGETVADVGAGTGYFSLPLAREVGAQGKIYAVDAQPEMLALLRQKFNESGPFNIETVAAEAERTGLPVACCDLVFLANVWHEFASTGGRTSNALAGRRSNTVWIHRVPRSGSVPPASNR